MLNEEIRQFLKACVCEFSFGVAPLAIFLVERAVRLFADGRIVERHTAALANQLPRGAQKRIDRNVKELRQQL